MALWNTGNEDTSDSEDEDLLLLLTSVDDNRKQNGRFWVHPILDKRNELGEFSNLIPELKLDSERFKGYFRLSPAQFDEIYDLVRHDISKQHTNWREPITARERLAICLSYLATGDSFKTIHFSFRVGHSTVTGIVHEVCEVIWNRLQALVMPSPTREILEKSAEQFKQFWQFPNCVGAIDGKHIQIQAPPSSGSMFFNYKGTFSIVLLALVDANYKFTVIDVGSYGKNSDGGILMESALGQSLHNGSLQIPEDCPLPGSGEVVSHVIVADEAFPLKTYMMRPYSGNASRDSRQKRLFNYRLSRARRIVENAFGILASRWRVYQRRIQMHPQYINVLVQTTCALHNFLRISKARASDSDVDDADMDDAGGMGILTALNGTGAHASQSASDVRDSFARYFSSPQGSFPWQDQVVQRGCQRQEDTKSL